VKKRPLLLALGMAVAATSVVAVIPSGSAGAAASPSTIAQALVALNSTPGHDAQGFDKKWNDYDIVTKAVLLFPDLVAAASDPTAKLTVLAPTDQAFRVLAQQLFHKTFKKESDVFAAIATLPASTIKTILLYHIVGAKLAPSAVLASDDVAVQTLGGSTFTVDVISKRHAFVQFVDGDPKARNPFLVAPSVGGELANGFVHGIDRVLRPFPL
jgi:uncharacterized surface protein with fasciclin (FAS1) repeats